MMTYGVGGYEISPQSFRDATQIYQNLSKLGQLYKKIHKIYFFNNGHFAQIIFFCVKCLEV